MKIEGDDSILTRRRSYVTSRSKITKCIACECIYLQSYDVVALHCISESGSVYSGSFGPRTYLKDLLGQYIAIV